MGSTQAKISEHPDHGTVLVWVKVYSSMFSPLSFNILRVVCIYLKPAPCLFWITNASLLYYNFDLDNPDTILPSPRIPLTRVIQANGNSRWAVIDSHRAVLCGGGSNKQAWKSGYLVNRAGGVQVLPEMLWGHVCAGVVVRKATVLVFGSSDEKGERSCESLQLPGTIWTELGEMHRPRYCFTPAIWQAAIYLCGGQYNNNTIEVLHGQQLHLLEFSLPEGGRTLACAPESTLLVISLNYMTVLSCTEKQLSCTSKKREGENVLPYTNPVCWQHAIFNIEDRHLRKYSIENGQTLQ